MSKDFSTLYHSGKAIFGEDPEPLLVNFVSQIPTTAPALDLGCGQGRNSLYLAGKGLSVTAIDPYQIAVDQTLANAKQLGVEISASVASIQDYAPAVPAFGAVLAFGLIPILTRDDIRLLTEKVMEWTQPSSLIFVTAFTSDDSSFVRYGEQGKQIGDLSFELDDRKIRTFLAPGEILRLFDSVDIIHHWEGLGPWHQHGDTTPERHAWAQLVAKQT